MLHLRWANVALIPAFVAACSGADARPESKRVAESPTRTTVDSAALNRAFVRASQLPRLRSLVIQWKDSTIGEKYYGSAGPDRRTNIKSASRSIISALTGIAIAQGKIRSVDQTIGELLPAETRGLDSVKRSITVGQLLSMRSGLQPTSFGNYGTWVTSSNVARTVSPFNGNRYGYGWWKRSAHGHDIHYAWGYGGQFIFVVPSLELVVVMTSDSETERDGGHNRELHRILEDELIPSVMVR